MDLLARLGPKDSKERQALKGEQGKPDLQVLKAPQGQQVPKEIQGKEKQGQPDLKVTQAPPAPRDRPDLQDLKDPWVQLARQVQKASREFKDSGAKRELQDQQV